MTITNKQTRPPAAAYRLHNQVLETGSVPLALLEEKIQKWIADNKS